MKEVARLFSMVLVVSLAVHVNLPAPVPALLPALECQVCTAEAASPPASVVHGPRSEAEVRLKIDELQQRIDGIDVNWPPGPTILTMLGYAGVLLLPPGLFLVGATVGTPAAGSYALALGAYMTGLGLLGVALLVPGLILGKSAANTARQERDELVRQRLELDRQLKELRKTRAAPIAQRPSLSPPIHS